MTRARQAYLVELRRVAERLGIPAGADLERRLIEHFQNQVSELIARLDKPKNLSELVDILGTCLGVEFVEIHDDSDLRALVKRIPEAVVAGAVSQLDDDTDAITVRRKKPGWAKPFLAIINCRGRHGYRRFFSKWHELVHLLLGGEELQLSFRKTLAVAQRHDPEETLVDVVAGAIAFHPDIFDDVFSREYALAGRVTFELVDRVKSALAPDASRHSTMKACARRSPAPVILLRARLGLKRSEEASALVADGTPPVPKLRVQEVDYNDGPRRPTLRLHRNMRVPETSVVMRAFRSFTRVSLKGIEDFEIWTTSLGGPIGAGIVAVEAIRTGDDVWALLHLRT